MAKHFFDRLSQGHVTQRRKRSTLFATSTPSSGLDVFPHAQDNSSSSKNNTQQQLRSPSPPASPTQTVISHRNSVGKETFCEQMRCDVETDPSYSQVPEFVPVKVKSKGSCKTGEKKTVKKARTGKKKIIAVKNNAESSPDRSQGEECAQNAKKLLQPKVATCSSETEVCEMGQQACVGAFDKKNRFHLV